METKGVIFSLCDFAQDFVRSYNNPKLEQNVINAIIIDYINYFAAVNYCSDLRVYTRYLKGKKLLKDSVFVNRQKIGQLLELYKDGYLQTGIIRSVNRNRDMNECNGKARAKSKDALKLIEDFISAYKAS